MARPDLDETRRILHAMFGTLQDCDHSPANVRQVLRELGFVSDGRAALADREYQSWFPIAPRGVLVPDGGQR